MSKRTPVGVGPRHAKLQVNNVGVRTVRIAGLPSGLALTRDGSRYAVAQTGPGPAVSVHSVATNESIAN